VDEPASEFDVAWKEALEWFFEPFLSFFFPTPHGSIDWSRTCEFLDKELQQIVPEAATGHGTVDKLVKVWTPAGQEAWVLVHVEVQSQPDNTFAERMYRYNHRLQDKYGRMPVSLAILGDERANWRPDTHGDGLWGCEVRFTFPTVKLVDYKDEEAALEANPNPFAAITLAHLKSQETKNDPADRYDWKMRLVKGLYDRGFNKLQMRRLFRLIDWVIKLSRAQHARFKDELDRFEQEKQMPLLSPTEELWREDAINEGKAEGKAQGMAQGKAQGMTQGIEAILDIRFGAEGLALMSRVRQIADPAILEQLLRASRTASNLDTFRAMLPPQD
jgi:hypothetical protein